MQVWLNALRSYWRKTGGEDSPPPSGALVEYMQIAWDVNTEQYCEYWFYLNDAAYKLS